MLKQDPASLDGTKTLMGSRRMATAFSTLVHGVQDTPAADPKTERIAPSENIQKKGTANVASQAATAAPAQEVVMTDSVENSIEIDAPPQLCYQVAAKLDDYPKWVASLESVEVLEAGSDGLANQAKFAVGAFGQTLDYTLQYTHEVPQKLSWKAVAGSVKALVGSYSFEALDGGKRTRVTYKLALDPGFSIPSMIKKASTKLIVSTALSDLRKYTEKPATKELIQGMLESRGSSDTTPAAVDAGNDFLLAESVQEDTVIDATPAECYEVAAAFAEYQNWVSSLQYCEELDTGADGRGRLVEFKVGAFGQTLDYKLEYAHQAPKAMTWKAVSGSVKALVGSYIFDPVDDGEKTRVTYRLALDPGFPVPGMIKTATTKLIVGTALNDLRKYIEQAEVKEIARQRLAQRPSKASATGASSPAAAAAPAQEVVMTDSVENSIEIDAPPQLCYQVAAKLDDYPKWVASLESVEVLEAGSDGLANQAKFAVGAFGQTLDYTLQYTHEVPQKLSWKAVAGSVKALVGSYSFEALDGGKRTRVTYKLALDPGFSIPSMIKKASTKLIVSTALSDLRKYTEKPATKELIQGMLESRGSSDTTPAAVDAGAQEEEQKEEVPMTVAEKVQGLKAVLNDAPLSTSTYARNKNPWDV